MACTNGRRSYAPSAILRHMSDSKKERVPKTIRLTPDGVKAVQEIADRYGVDWSEAARRMLGVAYPKMPREWHVKEF